MIKEEALSSRQRYLKILSNLTPAGAVGVSLLVLGAAVPAAASVQPAGTQTSAIQDERVSERLAAIREAVSAGAEVDPAATNQEQQLSWWCNGGGCGWGWRGRAWGFPNWGNAFPNFRNWGNGGWGNGWRY
ncbi:MAG: GrrA/OscA1 family cyclophane-containing rSAM-modified RiPP [Alphaproteobacteria bacterium]